MTILFLISLLVLCGMIASKTFENKLNRLHFVSELFSKGDHKIHAFIDHGVVRYYRYKKIGGLFVFEFLPSYTYEVLVKVKSHVAKKYSEAEESFRGRKILKGNGSVSFFLERLSEEKKVEKKSQI